MVLSCHKQNRNSIWFSHRAWSIYQRSSVPIMPRMHPETVYYYIIKLLIRKFNNWFIKSVFVTEVTIFSTLQYAPDYNIWQNCAIPGHLYINHTVLQWQLTVVIHLTLNTVKLVHNSTCHTALCDEYLISTNLLYDAITNTNDDAC